MSNNTMRTIGFLVILLVISMAVNGYFVYDKYFKKEKDEIKEIDNGPEEIAITLDKDNLLVNDLYKMLTYENERVLVDNSLYSDKLIMSKDLTNKEKLARIYKNIGEYISMSCSLYNEIKFKLLSNPISGMNIDSLLVCNSDYLQYNSDYNKNGYPVVHKISLKEFQEEAKKVFGRDTLVVLEDFAPAYNDSCITKDDDVYCISFATTDNIRTVNLFIKALKYNDRIEVYNKLATYDDVGRVYTNPLKNNLVGNNYDYTKNDLFNKYDLKIYKHVFKMNNDGSYYWFSSEPYSGEL